MTGSIPKHMRDRGVHDMEAYDSMTPTGVNAPQQRRRIKRLSAEVPDVKISQAMGETRIM
eukprot:907252-Pyramimonas_sp.AAC.1